MSWGEVNWQEVGQNIVGSAKSAASFLDSAIDVSQTLVGIAGATGYAGFVFDIAQDETVELDSEITDHYVETGSPVQDHIALHPERVTVSGLVGEYKNIVTEEQGTIEKAVQKLTTLASYLPAMSQAATAIYKGLSGKNNASSLSFIDGMATAGILNTGMQLFDAYRNINIPQNEQQKAFIFFEALRNNRTTFTIQTPFRYYTNMAIERMRAQQDAYTEDWSEFSITFKKIRYVDTRKKIIDESTAKLLESQGRRAEQIADTVDKGQVRTSLTGVTSYWGIN